MRIRLIIFFLTFCAILITFCPAIADELHLLNGDVISGQIIRMEENKLFFKTSYAGDIQVNWAEVRTLVSDDPIKVILSDETVLEGFARKAPVSMMRLETQKLKAPSDFKLSEVTAINPGKKPVVKITARTDVGFTQEKGNTDAQSIRLDGEFVARTEKSRYTVRGELNKERADGDTTVENWLAYGNYSYFLTRKWFAYAQTLFEHDKFADLDLRSTLGTGIGYQFYESQALNLAAGIGPAWVNEDFIVAKDDDYAAGQWLIGYDQYFFNNAVQLFHRQTGWIKATDSKKWVVKTRQGLRFPIYKGFTTTLQYNYDYDNDPSADADEKWDSSLMFLLGWQFGN